MKKKLAIKDIAAALNVSETSVSVVLNGKARQNGISVKLEDKILSFVKQVGYRPNRLAQGLRTGKTMTIGMVVEDISDPFFSAIARAVEEQIYQHGYRIIYGSSENSPEIANDLIQTFKNYQVDGYIIAPTPGLEGIINQLIIEGNPVVQFDRSLPGLPGSVVTVDNFRGSEAGTLHLIENHFRNIAFITLSDRQNQMEDRVQGYRNAMRVHALLPIVKEVVYKESAAKAALSIKNLLKARRDVDALFFSTNYLAMSGLEAMKELGLKAGRDLGVVVFDDNTNFSLFNPAITAVAQPVKEIGLQVTRILLEELKDDHMIDSQNILLKTKLVVRDSSGPLPSPENVNK